MPPTRGEKLLEEAKLVRLRTQAAFLHSEHPHMTAAEIGRRLGKTRQWVRKWWNRDDARSGARTGRPRKLTPPIVKTIEKTFGGFKRSRRGGYISNNDYATTISKVKQLHGVKICRRSVQNGARAAGLVAKKRKTKPFFTNATKESRLRFAQVIGNYILHRW